MILFCPTCRFTLEPNDADAVMYKKTQPKHCGGSMQFLDRTPEPSPREELVPEPEVPKETPKAEPESEPKPKKGLFGLGGSKTTKKKAKK